MYHQYSISILLFLFCYCYVIEEHSEYYKDSKMQTTSILKEADTNVQTKDSSTDDHKWLNKNDVLKIKSQFKAIQIKLLNMFTLAKSQLSSSYQKTVGKVKRIQKCMGFDTFKPVSSFWNLLQEIELELEEKNAEICANIQKLVVSQFLFDQLLAFLPDSCTSQKLMISHKKINNSSISSGGKLGQKMNNQTIADLETISDHEYRTALKIRPNDKRIDNLGCISGKWDVLEIICLENKQISRVIPFSTVIADTLQEINLSHNEISKLDFLKQAEYPILRTLNLQKNLITSLDGIQHSKLQHLKFLNLSDNKLKRLDYLSQCYFPELIEINLSSNRLQKMDSLIRCDFPKLEVLNLDRNIIPSLDFILSCTFYRIKILSFCYNQVTNIDCLKKCRLMKLQALLGYNNKIESIDFLENCDFPQLKQIILNNNSIKDIGVVQKLKFTNLTEFDLQNNKIEPEEVLCFTTKSSQSKRAKKKYPFIQL